MLRLQFSTGFNLMVNVETDLPALARLTRTYERLLDVPGRNMGDGWHMDVTIGGDAVRLWQPEMEAMRRSRWSSTMHLFVLNESVLPSRMERVAIAIPEIVDDDVELMRPWPRPWPRPNLLLEENGSVPPAVNPNDPINDFTMSVDDGLITVDTAFGEVILNVEHDIPALRRFLIDGVLDGEEMSIPLNNVTLALPAAGDVTFTPDNIRFHALALLEARRRGPGPDSVAVATVDGVNHIQDRNESTAEFEQRTINSMMMRRANDLMRDRGMTPAAATAEVRRILAESGAAGLVPPAFEMRAPSAQVAHGLRSLTVEEHERLATIISRWYLDAVRTQADDDLIARSGLTIENIRWFNVQVLEGQKVLPDSVLEPTLMEAWRD